MCIYRKVEGPLHYLGEILFQDSCRLCSVYWMLDAILLDAKLKVVVIKYGRGISVIVVTWCVQMYCGVA